MTEKKPIKPMPPVAPAPEPVQPSPPITPHKPYMPPKPPVMPMPHYPEMALPTQMYCDPHMLRQLYHQMKICHRYEREMLRWYMRYCIGERRRPFFGDPYGPCGESSVHGAPYGPHHPFKSPHGHFESSSSSRYWESSS